MIDWSRLTRDEVKLCKEIAQRWKKHGSQRGLQELEMDVEATHLGGGRRPRGPRG